MAQTTVTAKILADASGFSKGLNKAMTSLRKFSSAATKAGRDISVAISAPLILAGKAAFDVAREFDFAQAKLRGLKPTADFVKLEKTARKLGENTIFTAAEVANLQVELAKMGAQGSEITQLQEPILNLAQAMDIDLATAAGIAIKTVKRFNDTFDETETLMDRATKVSDVFAKATQESTLTSESLRVSFGYVGAEAKNYGLSLEKTTALLALLSDRGYEASRGGTALRRVLGQLAKDGLNADQALEQLFQGTGNYNEALDRFGLRGAGAASVLGGLRGEFEELVDVLERSEGTTQNFADEIEKSLEARVRKLQSALTELALKLDDEFGEALRETLTDLTEFVKSLSQLDATTKKNVVQALAFVAVLGPLLLVLGAITSAVSVLVTAGAGLVKWVGRAFAGFRLLLIELGLLPGAWLAQSLAARGATLSMEGVTVAATGARVAVNKLRLAMRRVAVLVALEGILVLIQKVQQAREELAKGEEAVANASRNERQFSESREEELEKLKDLPFAEVAKRLKKGAASLTEAYMRGQTAVPLDQISESLIDPALAKKVLNDAEVIRQFQPGLSSSEALDLAIKGQIDSMRSLSEETERKRRVDEGSITTIDDLKAKYELLTKEILDAQSKFKQGEQIDFDEIAELQKAYKDVTSKLKLFGVENVKTFKDIIDPDVEDSWFGDLIKQFEEANPALAELEDSYEKSEKALKKLRQTKLEYEVVQAEEIAKTGEVSKAVEDNIAKVSAQIEYYSALQDTQQELLNTGLVTKFESENKAIADLSGEYDRAVAALTLLEEQRNDISVAAALENAENGKVSESLLQQAADIDTLIAYYEALKIAFDESLNNEKLKEFNSNIQELQASALTLGNILATAFQNAFEGTESFAKSIRTSLMKALSNLLTKLAAVAIAWGIIALLATIATGGSNIGSAAASIKGAGFTDFLMGSFGMGSLKSTGETGGLKVQGVLSGSDLSISTKRGVTANERIYG